MLVGPATRAVTGHLFSWGAAEEVALSGHPRPLVASYLDAPRARVAERRPRLGGRATLVDRDAEMRVLDGALRAAVSGHGSVVLLTAEPGLGKTRLVQECRKRFIAWVGAGSGRLPLWLEGRGASYASADPYSLYRQLVASWVGVSPDQPEARLRPALETALAHLMGNTNLLPPLARMMGAARGAERQAQGRIGPEELQRMTFGAVRSVVSRFAAAGPTVLVLEDLHWADPTSLRLTLELAELAAGRPLLVLATTRPDAGPEVAALAARGETRQLELRPLSADAADGARHARCIGGKVAGPRSFAAVLANADGNPLFLEERLSSMLETGTLVRDQGAWRLRRTADPRCPRCSSASSGPGSTGSVRPPRRRSAPPRCWAPNSPRRCWPPSWTGSRPCSPRSWTNCPPATWCTASRPPPQPLPVPPRPAPGGHLPGPAARGAP